MKPQIKRALDALDAAGGGPAVGGRRRRARRPPRTRSTTSPSRPSRTTPPARRPTCERIVHDAIASKLAELGEYQLAPVGRDRTRRQGGAREAKLKGFYLGVSVDKFDYSDGNLRVRVKIAVFSYPGRDLRGEVPAGATLPGARPGDTGAEDQLMSVVAARAAELFAQNFR